MASETKQTGEEMRPNGNEAKPHVEILSNFCLVKPYCSGLTCILLTLPVKKEFNIKGKSCFNVYLNPRAYIIHTFVYIYWDQGFSTAFRLFLC